MPMPQPNPYRAAEEAKLVIKEKERLRDNQLKKGFQTSLKNQKTALLVLLLLLIAIGALMFLHFS